MVEDNQQTEEYAPEWFTRIMQLEGAADAFRLKSLTKPNTTSFPNFYMDWLMAYLTGEEWKVLSYIVRRTFGFHDEDIRKGIAVSIIANGFTSPKDGRQLELGTGLSTATICKAVDYLEELGLIIVTKRMGAPALYQINFGDDPRFPFKVSALATREAKLQQRLGPTMVEAAAHARKKLAEKRAEGKPIDMALETEDNQYFTAQKTDASILPRKTQYFTAQKNSILPRKSIKESLEIKPIERKDTIFSAPCPHCQATVVGKPRGGGCPSCGAALLSDAVGGYTVDLAESIFLAFRDARGKVGKPTRAERADAMGHCKELHDAGYTAAQVGAFTGAVAGQEWTQRFPTWGLAYVCKHISEGVPKSPNGSNWNGKLKIDASQQIADDFARQLAEAEAGNRKR